MSFSRTKSMDNLTSMRGHKSTELPTIQTPSNSSNRQPLLPFDHRTPRFLYNRVFTRNQINLEGAHGSSVQNDLTHTTRNFWSPPLNRFRYILSEPEIERQLGDRDKKIRALKLTKFAPTSEKDMEDWVDNAAAQATRARVCFDIFQEIWVSQASHVLGRIIELIDSASSFEVLCDEVALRIFPVSDYVHEIEDELRKGKRHASILEAQHYLAHLYGRYERLCKRRDICPSIQQHHIVNSMFKSFPQHLEFLIRSHFTLEKPKPEDILKAAFHLEAEYNRTHSPKSTVQTAYTIAADIPMNDVDLPRTRRIPPSPCPSCGNEGHWKNECKYKEYRCSKCNRIGHIAQACRSFVKKDTEGRIITRVEDAPKGLTLETRDDRTTADRVKTASNVLNMLKEVSTGKAVASKARREKKKQRENFVPVREPKEHPIQVVQGHFDPSDSEISYESSSEENNEIKTLTKSAYALHRLGVVDPEKQVRCIIKIGNDSFECIADTGSRYSLCSTRIADIMGLTNTEETSRFKGLGHQSASLASPIEATLIPLQRTCKIAFFVTKQLDFETIIGADDLAAFDVVPDPVTKKVYPREFLIASPVIESQVNHQTSSNLISGIDDDQSDESLISRARTHFESLTSQLSESKKEQLWNLLIEFKDTWLRPTSGNFTGFKGSFEVIGPPKKARLRHLSPPIKEECERQITELLQNGLIRPSKSPWASAPVFAQKKNGKWRMALNYIPLNKQMVSDAYPLPLLWDILQEAAHHRFYTLIDCNWGFWNIALEENSIPYTAVITHLGIFEFTVLPFGIKNSPAIFQRAMDSAFSSLYHQGTRVYVDDIVNFHNDWNDHITSIRNCCCLARKAKIYFNFYKIIFPVNEIVLLGHICGERGILPSPKKIEALYAAKPPTTKSTLHSFLGLATYLSRFVPNFSEVAAPLFDLLKRYAPFDWTTYHQNAFDQLRRLLAEQILLTAPRGNGSFVIICDASQMGLGSALTQIQNDHLALLEFASRRLTEAEMKWDTREREGIAIKWAVSRFSDYIKAGPFFIASDHESLRWMESDSSRKVQRWALYLQQYDFTFIHISGSDNHIADWLSRSLPDDPDADKIIDAIAIPSYHVQEVINGPNASLMPTLPQPYLPSITDFKIAIHDLTPQELRDTFISNDGVRYHIHTKKLFVPINLRDSMIYWFHASKHGTHVGSGKTIRRLKKWVWWINMAQDVHAYVNNCLICIRMQRQPTITSLFSVLSRPLPLQLISMDYVGPMNREDPYIASYCIIIDHASRFIVAKPTKHGTCAESINTIQNYWCSVFQAPHSVLTDNGSPFLKEFSIFVTNELLAYHIFSSPYYPQGNSINESSHKAINRSLASCYQAWPKTSFAEALRAAVSVHNSTPHSTTGVTPFYSLFGCEPTLPGWQTFHDRPDEQVRKQRQIEMRNEAILRANLQQEGYRATHSNNFIVGDWIVYYLSEYERKVSFDSSKSIKLSPKWSLPAKVIEVTPTNIKVIDWGRSSFPSRTLALSQVRKLQGEVPQSLQALTLELLERRSPKAVRHRLPPTAKSHIKPIPWQEFLNSATPAEPLPKLSKKRQRTTTTTENLTID